MGSPYAYLLFHALSIFRRNMGNQRFFEKTTRISRENCIDKVGQVLRT